VPPLTLTVPVSKALPIITVRGPYVLSFATIIQVTPSIMPRPVIIPPAGTSSPGYTSYPANGDSSRKDVPGSMRVVMRLNAVGDLAIVDVCG
jgi:hypothetical protein